MWSSNITRMKRSLGNVVQQYNETEGTWIWGKTSIDCATLLLQLILSQQAISFHPQDDVQPGISVQPNTPLREAQGITIVLNSSKPHCSEIVQAQLRHVTIGVQDIKCRLIKFTEVVLCMCTASPRQNMTGSYCNRKDGVQAQTLQALNRAHKVLAFGSIWQANALSVRSTFKGLSG